MNTEISLTAERSVNDNEYLVHNIRMNMRSEKKKTMIKFLGGGFMSSNTKDIANFRENYY